MGHDARTLVEFLPESKRDWAAIGLQDTSLAIGPPSLHRAKRGGGFDHTVRGSGCLAMMDCALKTSKRFCRRRPPIDDERNVGKS
jgi:hypothetical protein